MDELLTYRIFRAFKKKILEDPLFKKRLLSLAHPAESKERLIMNSTTCVVDETWVNMIETHMDFLIKAVAEERQFVRSEGEVLPIERVRSVSKDSIEDLGKHSNYLTHDPATTGGKVIPDRLLVSKKESDFKVYENRFLYTALVYLCQFIELRLNEIVAISGRYEGNSHYLKVTRSPNATTEFEMTLKESRLNDPVALNQGGSAQAIRRISSFLATARTLLDTPLMKEVSEAPMVKMPITKTNIIRFDPNFQGALELYLFLHSYDKKGYELKTESREINALSGRSKEDFALLLFLNSFFTYMYGNALDEELHNQSEEQNEKERLADLAKAKKAMEKARRDMESQKDGPEKYILAIEEAERALEKELSLTQEKLGDQEQFVKSEVKRLASLFDDGLARQEKEFADAMQAKDDEVRLAKEDLAKQLQAKDEEVAAAKKECALSLAQKDAEKAAVLEEKAAVERALEEEKRHGDILKAEIIAAQQRAGKKDFEAMTSKEKFAYLDAQKKAFDAYCKEQWALTKKAIREEAFATHGPKKKEKKKKGGKGE